MAKKSEKEIEEIRKKNEASHKKFEKWKEDTEKKLGRELTDDDLINALKVTLPIDTHGAIRF